MAPISEPRVSLKGRLYRSQRSEREGLYYLNDAITSAGFPGVRVITKGNLGTPEHPVKTNPEPRHDPVHEYLYDYYIQIPAFDDVAFYIYIR